MTKRKTHGAEAKLAAHAAAYPGVREEAPWGHRAFKINKKVFLFLGGDSNADGGLSLSIKLPISSHVALMLPFAEPTGYGLGKSGWVSASFGPKDQVPVEMLLAWIDESFRAIAPKKVIKALDGESTPVTKTVAKTKSKPKAKVNAAASAKRERSARKR